MRTSKKLILPICIALVILLTLGGVVAYIAVKTGTLVNTFDAGNIVVNASNPNDGTMVFSAISTDDSDTDAYVRFKVVATWVSTTNDTNLYAGAPVLDRDYSLSYDNAKIIKLGDFYYVKDAVSKNETVSLITAMLLDGTNETANTIQQPTNYQLKIEVLTDAIQSKPESAAEEAWGVEITDGVITGLKP